jgi:hypothetical protein
MKESDDLKEILKVWQPKIEVPTDFNSQVWRRIATQEQDRSNRWWNRLALIWLQPKWCAAVVALVLLGSVAGGQIQSNRTMTRQWNNLEGRYLTSIDPYSYGGK